jgi:DNA-binding winged helix-turn-helix (wHTH) protein
MLFVRCQPEVEDASGAKQGHPMSVYRFQDFELDDQQFLVTRRDATVPLQRRTFDLVRYLLAHRDRVVDKAELLAHVWPGVKVGDSSLKRAVLMARRALGTGIIVSVRGRGYRFMAPVSAEAPAEPRRDGPHLVGRARELEQLREALAAAANGNGRLCLIVGEPGMGKTRLLEELSVAAAAADASVLWGRCWEMGGAPPFWPWPPLIRALLVGCAGEDASRVEPLFSGSRGHADALPPDARFQLFDTVARLVVRHGNRPLVLLLDDLHAADEPARRLLQFVVREIRAARVLIVATSREPLDEMTREAEVVTLGGLREDAVGALAAELLERPLAAGERSALYETTQGNPLFVELLCAAGLEAPSVPSGIREAVTRRLAILDDETRAALTEAAVLGRDIDVQDLAGLCRESPEATLGRLTPAIAAGVLLPGLRPGELRFGHVLVREVLYESLPLLRRSQLHARAGELCEHKGAERQAAEHYYRALPCVSHEKARELAVRAAAAAEGALAYEEAAASYERAVELLEIEDHTQLELLHRLGRNETLAGRPNAAMVTFQRAARLARRLGSAEALARAALGWAVAFRPSGVHDEALEALLYEALDAVGTADSPLRVELLAGLAINHKFGPKADRCLALARGAVAVARRLNDRAALAHALFGQAVASLGGVVARERLPGVAELVELAEGDKTLLLDALLCEVVLHLEGSNLAGLETGMVRHAQLAQARRHPYHLWWAAVLKATRAMMQGNLDRAEELVWAAQAMGERLEDPTVPIHSAAQLFGLRFAQGRLSEMVPVVAAMVETAPTLDFLRAALGLAFVESGDLEAARRELELLAADDFSALPRDTKLFTAIFLAAELAVAVGDERRASLLYPLLSPWGEDNFVGEGASFLGPVAHVLGSLDEVLRRAEPARRWYLVALKRAEALDARPWAARARSAVERLGRPD